MANWKNCKSWYQILPNINYVTVDIMLSVPHLGKSGSTSGNYKIRTHSWWRKSSPSLLNVKTLNFPTSAQSLGFLAASDLTFLMRSLIPISPPSIFFRFFDDISGVTWLVFDTALDVLAGYGVGFEETWNQCCKMFLALFDASISESKILLQDCHHLEFVLLKLQSKATFFC